MSASGGHMSSKDMSGTGQMVISVGMLKIDRDPLI